MRQYRKYLLILVPVTAAAVAAFYLFLKPLPVVVASPEANVSVQVYGLGTVEARILSRIGFQALGTLAGLAVDQGDRVRAGTVLASLDLREQAARVAQATAAVRQAGATVHQAEADLTRARTVLDDKERINRRQQALLARKLDAVEVAEAAQTEADVAVAEAAQAQGPLDVARADLEQAQATVQLEATVLTKHTLTAPYDAQVVERHQELGAVLNPGESVFTLMDPTTVWVQGYVDEARAGPLRLGQSADIRLRSRPGRVFAGRVARIDIESDRVSEERKVAVAFVDPPPDLHLGEQAEVWIEVARLDAPLLVPTTAVQEHADGSASVWTVEDGVLTWHTVTLGHRLLDGRVEITAGVPAAAQVVSETADGLRVGRRAYPVDEVTS